MNNQNNMWIGRASLGSSDPLNREQFEQLVQNEIGDFVGGFDPFDNEEDMLKIRDYISSGSEDTAFEFYHYGMRDGDNGFINIATNGEQGYANISSDGQIIRGDFLQDFSIKGGVYVSKQLAKQLKLKEV